MMKYWASSRVGAVPQGQPSKQKKRSERYSKKKGITMEDLKKQTALRLAQEQQKKQSRAFGGNGYATAKEASSDPAYSVVEPPAAPRLNVSQAGGQVDRLSYSNHQLTASSNAAPTVDHERYQANPGLSGGGQVENRNYRYDQYQGIGNDSPHTTSLGGTPSPLPVVASSTGYNQQEQFHTRSLVPTNLSASYEAAQDSTKGGSSKAKLPHGLTVYELKEMTKARLQAEASDKSDQPSLVSTPVPSTTSSSLNALPDYPEQRNTGNVSPVPPGFQGNTSRSPYPGDSEHSRTFVSQNRDCWSQESRTEAWETASVSTVASDYLGSESPFPMNGMQSHSVEDLSTNAFGRSRTYPTNRTSSTTEMLPTEGNPPLTIPSGSYFESPVFGNRRRAATLSPRSGLGHLHEDRPLMPGNDLPTLPSFTESTMDPSGRKRSNTYSADSLMYGSGLIGDLGFNRERTSSTSSLPSFSNSGEDIGADNSSSRFASQFGSVREESPVTGLADVFRESPSHFGTVQAPPGLVKTGSGGIAATDSFGEPRIQAPTNSFGGESNRSRAATWGEPSTDVFGPGLIPSNPRAPVFLSDDLASILKLSGAEERPERTLYSPPGL